MELKVPEGYKRVSFYDGRNPLHGVERFEVIFSQNFKYPFKNPLHGVER
jgi:hypothetical protein